MTMASPHARPLLWTLLGFAALIAIIAYNIGLEDGRTFEIASAILVYGLIVLMIWRHRSRFEFQAKVIALLRTNIGIKLMKRIVADRDPRAIAWGEWITSFAFPPIVVIILLLLPNSLGLYSLPAAFIDASIMLLYAAIAIYLAGLLLRPIERAGTHAVIAGYIGQILIVAMLVYGVVLLFIRPDAPATVGLVLPGISLPGSAFTVPIWQGIAALFIVVAIHEFSHGIMSKAHKVPITSSGVGVMAILPLAFVEPDEKRLEKMPKSVQNKVFAAGPGSNLILAGLITLILGLIIFPAADALTQTDGVLFGEVREGYPAQLAGVREGVLYTHLDGERIGGFDDLLEGIEGLEPGDAVTISNERLTHTIIATGHPDNASSPYLGVTAPRQHFPDPFPDLLLYAKEGINPIWLQLLLAIGSLLFWTYVLSLGIGLANLLPIGPVDGGRMLFNTLRSRMSEKRAMHVLNRVSLLFLIIILILVLTPILKALVPGLG